MKLDGAHISGELNRLLSRSPGSESSDNIADIEAAVAGKTAMADVVVSAMKQSGDARPANKPSFLEELAKKKGIKKDSCDSSSSDSLDSNAVRPPAKPLSFLEELAKKNKKEPSVSQDDAEPNATALPTAKPSFLDELKRKKKGGGDSAEDPTGSSNDTAAAATSTPAAPRRPSFLEELANKKKAVDG